MTPVCRSNYCWSISLDPCQRFSTGQSTGPNQLLPGTAPRVSMYCSQYPDPRCPDASIGLCTQQPVMQSFGHTSVNASPLHARCWLLAHHRPTKHRWRSFRFSPPHCYQASLAGISSLLRDHLPPCMPLMESLSYLLHDHPQEKKSRAAIQGFPS